MIKKLSLQNFTVFEQANLEFSPGLNVIIGENGLGKTHLLKLGYILSNAWSGLKTEPSFSKERVGNYFSDRIRFVFKPDKVGNLARSDSEGKAEVFGSNVPMNAFDKPNILEEVDWKFTFSNRSKENVVMEAFGVDLKDDDSCGKSVFLPSKEILSFFDGFLALSVKREIQFDETYSDLALNLATPKLKVSPPFIQHALSGLIDDVGGTLELVGGKFYLVSKGEKRQEITLVAEGIRKLATVIHLIENGSLEQGDTLFWDEPESNLNPKLIKDVAAALLCLSENGIQVIIATHSLFLIREIDMLTKYEKTPIHYIGLSQSDQGLLIEQSHDIDDIQTIVSLDEDLEQSDRYMSWDEEQTNAGI